MSSSLDQTPGLCARSSARRARLYVHPPLTAAEVESLDRESHKLIMDRHDPRPETWLQRIVRLTAYHGTWKNLMLQLSSEDCDIPEPGRTGALVLLRAMFPPDLSTGELSCWQYSTSSSQGFWLESFWPHFAQEPNALLFTLFAQSYLKHLVLLAFIQLSYLHKGLDVKILHAAYDRAEAMFVEVEGVSPAFRAHHEGFLRNSRANCVARGPS
ncbi:hypothetical protein JCM8097_000979 [Rhodosporidiobolus ruineniae]